MSSNTKFFTGTHTVKQPGDSGSTSLAAMIAAESDPASPGIVRIRLYPGMGVKFEEEHSNGEHFLTLEFSEEVFDSIQRYGLQTLMNIQHLRMLNKLGVLKLPQDDHD